MPVDIRALKTSDEGQWRTLWTAYLDFYGTIVPDEVYETTFQRLLGDDTRDFSCLVAEADGQLVGLTHYLFHRHAWKIQDVCYLQDLYTDASCRGQGVARALIQSVYDVADQSNAPGVYWLTQDSNTTARVLYDKVAGLTPFLKYQRVLS